jgi:ATP-dependent exoDNAse (exonuclease V) beta subunit
MGSDRERFLLDVENNFSVQASAGTGKTTSIVERILNLARYGVKRGCAAEILGSLVVVTYTNRAANEMRERLRARVLADKSLGMDVGVRHGLAGMFVGTIHSWCMRIIEEFAGRYGYCVPDMGVQDEVRIEAGFGEFAKDFFDGYAERYSEVLRFISADELARMARVLMGIAVDWNEVCESRVKSGYWSGEQLRKWVTHEGLDEAWEPFLKGRGRHNVEFILEGWRRFREAVRGGDAFCAIPPEPEYGGKNFQTWFNGMRQEVVDELMRGVMQAAMEEAKWRQEYEFRVGSYSFNGQVVLAYRLLGMKEVRDVVLGRGHRVILDEAQDTDPLQFKLLMEMARPPDAGVYDWPYGSTIGPRAGHFCMVGDKQQAIYRDRSRLKDYQFYHEALTREGVGEALTLMETYRCRKNIVSWVNDRFSKILNGEDGQAQYVSLVAVEREDGFGGSVEHWLVDGRGENGKKCDYAKAAEACMKRIAELGCEGLGVKDWSDVAIVAPRGGWLKNISDAALKCGVPVVDGFSFENRDRIEWRWVAALLALDEDAGDEYEVAAVLREVLGYADEEIYRYKFPNDEEVRSLALSEKGGEGRVGGALRSLWTVRQTAKNLGLGAKLELWCEALRLKERMMLIDRGGAEALDDLLMEVWEHERSGGSVRTWLRKMRSDLKGKGKRSISSRGGAVELLTMQKAKGLEWEVVIVPFFWRAIKNASPSYPDKFMNWDMGRCVVSGALSKDLKSRDYINGIMFDKGEEMRELRRFYYVAATRAKQRLILVEEEWDEECKWTDNLGMACIVSEAEAREYTENRSRNWRMDWGDAGGRLLTTEANDPKPINPWMWDEPIGSRIHLQKELPVELGMEGVEKELFEWGVDREVKAKEPFWAEGDAVRYGLWWHKLMEGWPWGASEVLLQAYLSRMKNVFDDGNLNFREEKEINLWMQSELYSWVMSSGVNFFQEVRYFDAKVGAERVIDFMFQDAAGDRYLIDWKTEAVGDNDDFLLNEHKKQISEYIEGVSAAGITIKKAFIYSTVMGKGFEISY